jgi:inosose dehydratase
MAESLVGCGQITWNQFRHVEPDAWPEERVLDEIAQAGYAGAPAGQRDDRSAAETVAFFAAHGLRPAPGYMSGAFWEAGEREALLAEARRQGAFAREMGLDAIYVAAGGFDYVTRSGQTRRDTAGHVAPDDALTTEQYQRFGDTLNEVGAILLAEGVRAAFHNHVGTPIETREEIDTLLALTDPATVFLGPDTGHLAWAGADPVAFCRDYAARIVTLHLKDVDPAVVARGRAAGWNYRAFTDAGVFTELGDGGVDFPAIFAILREIGFAGWLIAETDVTQRSSALESATISREYLRSQGY